MTTAWTLLASSPRKISRASPWYIRVQWSEKKGSTPILSTSHSWFLLGIIRGYATLVGAGLGVMTDSGFSPTQASPLERRR